MFTHLHQHSEYSLLDGASPIDRLVKRAEEIGQTAMALTDHGWIAGAVKFTKACQERGVLPIIGSEVYIATQSDMKKAASNPGDNYHLTLLCADEEGYRNLMRLTSLAHLEGMSYKPRIDHRTLKAHAAGLMVLSGCVAAELPQALIYGKEAQARSLIEFYLDAFGDRFFIEVMAHGETDNVDHVRVEDEKGEVLMFESQLNEALVSLADRYGVPIVATNDAHYLTRDDGDAHDTLLCIGMGAWKEKAGRLRFPGAEHQAWEFYVKDEEEMRAASEEDFWQRACDNTEEVVRKVAGPVVNTSAESILPRFEVPEDDVGFKVWRETGILI